MPRTYYSEGNFSNIESSIQHHPTHPKRTIKINKKKHKHTHSKHKHRTHKTNNKTVIRYKSAFSPEYAIEINQIDLLSFHSDDLERSDTEARLGDSETIPYIDEDSDGTFRKLREQFQKRQLVRIMGEFCLSEEKMVE